MTCGVYGIFGPNDFVYIGSSYRIESRWADHRCDVKYDRHHCVRFGEAAQQFGLAAFSFVILEECLISDLTVREQHYMKLYETKLYNSARVAGSIQGLKYSDASRQKMSAAKLGKPKSDETKSRMSEASILRYSDPSERIKMSNACQGNGLREKLKQVSMTCRECGQTSMRHPQVKFCNNNCAARFRYAQNKLA